MIHPSRRLAFLVSAALIVFISTGSLLHSNSTGTPFNDLKTLNGLHIKPDNTCAIFSSMETNNLQELGPLKRRNIAVASDFTHHFDVYMALVWAIQGVLDMQGSGRVRVFARSFNFNFQTIVDKLSLYNGTLHAPDDVIAQVRDGNIDGIIDMVILGTCEIDLVRWHIELLSAWDARDEAHKFQLVCIVHNIDDINWQSRIPDWSRRSAIRLLPIADHVAKTFRRFFSEHADSTDRAIYTAGYENIPVDVHVPILDIRNLPVKAPGRTLSCVVIQGTFSVERRDYLNFFADLITSLREDPSSWGYLPPVADTFIPDPHSPHPPFEVWLVGAGSLEVPIELAYVVSLHRDLPYDAFYALVSRADIVVPAFAQFGYYENQASSTISLAVELDVPILATDRMRKAYGYIDDDRVVITRPAAMREVHALKALRTGDATPFLESTITETGRMMTTASLVKNAVDRMMQIGWMREPRASREFKTEIWMRNQEVIGRMLRDL